MTRISNLDLPDREGIERRISEAAKRLVPELRIDTLELHHLADVVTNHALLLNDLYATHRLDRIMGQDPSAIAHGLADLAGAEEDFSAETLLHLRRIPDDVRVVGDKCLYDVGLFGLERYRGLSLRHLGARCYNLASEILECLADDRRLRDFFRQNLIGPMPIEEEVIFLRQCAERFVQYADLLRSLQIFHPSGTVRDSLKTGSSTAAPPATLPEIPTGPSEPPPGPAPASDPGERTLEEAEEEEDGDEVVPLWAEEPEPVPAPHPEPLIRGLPGVERLPRRDLLSLYERLVLVANLDVPGLRDRLNRVVVDQQEAVQALCDELSLYATGTQAPGRPASFFLVGPTGVGKNHLAECFVQALESLWGIEVPMLLLEGPQYTYPSDINELKGAARGFIRSDEEGILTEFYKRASGAPLSVILVDEVEKAHPQLRKFFLGLMDRGTTMDNRGATLHFANTIFFFTSNVGYSRVQTSTAPIGFADAEAASDFKHREVVKDLKKILTPEFVNRLSVIRFRPLTIASVERIFDLEFEKVASRYREVQRIDLRVTRRAKERMIRQGYSPEFGARPLARLVNLICNIEVSKRLKRDEGRDQRETWDLLSYIREAREGKRALDPSALERVLEEARAHVDYDALQIGWDGRGFTYKPVRSRAS